MFRYTCFLSIVSNFENCTLIVTPSRRLVVMFRRFWVLFFTAKITSIIVKVNIVFTLAF